MANTYFENMLKHLKKMDEKELVTLIEQAQAELDLKKKEKK